MEKLIYYRGSELITPQQKRRMIKLWGTPPYVHFVELPLDHNTGTGIHEVTEILYTIWNNEKLNERSQALTERIKKGLTRSTAYYSDYVETNILHKLIQDAIKEFNSYAEDKIEKLPFDEFKRLYGLPISDSVIAEMDKEEKKIGIVEKPNKIIKFKSHWKTSQNQCSTYKHYYIKGTLSFSANYDREITKAIHDKFPYLGKLHAARSDGYIQLSVYDYKRSNNAMQNVLNYLVENYYITLS